MSKTMTTDEVMVALGYTNPRGVSSWCRRYDIKPLYKQPGHRGKNVYDQAAIEAGKKRMVGRGIGGGRPWPDKTRG